MVQCNPFLKLTEYYPSGMFSREYRNKRNIEYAIYTYTPVIRMCRRE